MTVFAGKAPGYLDGDGLVDDRETGIVGHDSDTAPIAVLEAKVAEFRRLVDVEAALAELEEEQVRVRGLLRSVSAGLDIRWDDTPIPA